MKKLLLILTFISLGGFSLQAQGPVNSAIFLPRPSVGYTNAIQSAVVPAALSQIFGYNSGPAQFLQIYDSASAGAAGSTPLISFRIFADANFSISRDQIPVRFTTGIYICNSTTGSTNTLGAADCLIYTQHNVTP